MHNEQNKKKKETNSHWNSNIIHNNNNSTEKHSEKRYWQQNEMYAYAGNMEIKEQPLTPIHVQISNKIWAEIIIKSA